MEMNLGSVWTHLLFIWVERLGTGLGAWAAEGLYTACFSWWKKDIKHQIPFYFDY